MSSCVGPKVVIVGGGMMGAATAYYLTRPGCTVASVTVVEAVAVAQAASGRAGGFLAKGWCDHGATKQLARRSYSLHSTLGQELGVECGYRTLDTVSLGVGPRGEARTGVPAWVEGAVTQGEVLGTQQDTAQVHPKQLTEALIAASGAEVVLAKVVGGRTRDGRVEGVELEDGRVLECDVVVLCMGPWTDRGLGWFGLKGLGIGGNRAHSITLSLSPGHSVGPTALFLSTCPVKCQDPEVYPRPDNTVYVCAAATGDSTPVPEDPAKVQEDPDTIQKCREVAKQVSSQLAGESYTSSACYLPTSKDGWPCIGPVPGVEGLYMAAGHSCWGILQGPATGEALAQCILQGRATTVDLSPFNPARFFSKTK